MKTTSDLLKERATTHGSFSKNADYFIDLLEATNVLESDLPNEDKVAIIYIAGKLSRVLSGMSVKEHWEDIAGYATLTMKTIDERDEKNTVDKAKRLSDLIP